MRGGELRTKAPILRSRRWMEENQQRPPLDKFYYYNPGILIGFRERESPLESGTSELLLPYQSGPPSLRQFASLVGLEKPSNLLAFERWNFNLGCTERAELRDCASSCRAADGDEKGGCRCALDERTGRFARSLGRALFRGPCATQNRPFIRSGTRDQLPISLSC
ncbi:hypothetical protein VTO42DRAFT_1910 [Malbranchea cinnamomea]